MSRVPRWDSGSRRRIRLIRWSRMGIVGVVVLAVSLMAFGFFLARWLASMQVGQMQEEESALVGFQMQ